MSAELEPWGEIDGVAVHRAILKNAHGMRAGVLSWGASLHFLRSAPDEGGSDMVLGFDHPSDYASKGGHLGATAGRFANRIAWGRFELDGEVFELPRNEGRAAPPAWRAKWLRPPKLGARGGRGEQLGHLIPPLARG